MNCPVCNYYSAPYQVKDSSNTVHRVCCSCAGTMLKKANGLAIKIKGDYLWETKDKTLEFFDSRNFFVQRDKFISGEVELNKILATVTLTYPDLDDVVWKEEKISANIKNKYSAARVSIISSGLTAAFIALFGFLMAWLHI